MIPSALEVVFLLLLKEQPLTDDKISVISQMIVQFDSFLAAGAAVGISIFWSDFAKTLRKLGLTYRKLKDELEELKPLTSNLSEKASQVVQVITETERKELPIAFLGVVSFVGSAILAVAGEMFSNEYSLVLSLSVLVLGTGLMFYSWYVFTFFGATFRQLMMDELGILSQIRREKKERIGRPN